MLHLLRRAAKTWAFRILFGLLIVSFAVWGVGDLSFGGAGTRVAQVGERRITVEDYALALSRELNAMSRRAERAITVEEAQTLGMPQALLARIVRDAALDDEARRLGLSADDAAVRDAIVASPSFQGLNGAFDEEQYRFVLDRLGFRVERFEDDLRRSLARDAVAYGVRQGARGAPGFAERLAEREFERRSFEAAELRLQDAPDPGEPSETELRAFHEAYPGLYEAPESRSVAWIEIDPAALASGIDISEEDLRAAYDAAADRYDVPERRVVDRIVFPDEAAAEAARAEMEAGETTFADLAVARGLSPADIDMGEVTRESAGAAEEAVFAGGLGVAGPAPTALGPALYDVRAILPARTTSFEDARDALRAELARAAAADAALERAEEVADLLAAGAALEGIAQDTGLPLRRADAIARDGTGAEGLAARPAFREELFAAEPGEERDVIDLGDGAFVLLRVEGTAPAAVQPFEAVRDRVARDWAQDRRRTALEARAAEALAQLEGGASFDDVAAGLGATVIRMGPMRRAEALGTLPEDAAEALFAAEAPGAARIAATETGLALLRLAAIEPADLSEGPAADAAARLREALDAAVADDLYAYYAAAVQDRAEVTLNEAALEQAINSLR